MKHTKRNAIIIALVTVVVLYFVLKDNFASVMTELQRANPIWITVAVLTIIVYCFIQSLALHLIIRNYKKDYPYKKTLQLTYITNFFNGITPFSTGGQPMQVYLLKKDGIKIETGTNIIMQNFILYQLALVAYGIIALGLNYLFQIFPHIPVLGDLIIVGFTINTLIMVGLFVISFSKKFNKWLINLGIKILSKLKIVKDLEKTKQEWDNHLETFHEGATSLWKNKKVCIQSFIYQFLSLTCYYILPFFVLKALGVTNEITMVEAIVSSAYVLIIGSFVPIPGASGGIEYGFLQFFGTFVTGSILSAGLIVWRFISYYLLMIIGGITLSFRKDESIEDKA